MFARSLALLAAASLSAAPALAQPSAQALSVQPAAARAGGLDDSGASDLGGGSWIAPVLFAAIVIGGVLLATGVLFDDDNEPASP